MKITFISWAQRGYNSRNELLAKSLGSTMHYINFGRQGSLFQAPVRYAVQALRMWRILLKERPDFVFVHNPPIFNSLVAFFFAKRYGAHFIIDSHTGAFISPKWRWSLGLHRILSHAAVATLVHNKHQEEIVKRWGCRYFLLGSFGREYPKGKPFPLSRKFNVAVVGSIIKKECLDIVFEAACRLPEVSFYITGRSDRVNLRLAKKKPCNCCLTDYLPDEQYVGLLQGVDAIIVQTTRPHTLCMGASEAVAYGTPLILSDWSISRDYFCRGTVHIPNTAEGVYLGICQAQRELLKLKEDILLLRSQLMSEWEKQFAGLWQLVQAYNPHVSSN